ncbi:MAG: hypothetical protein R3A12_00260 [Ignavibacteria bacterium]
MEFEISENGPPRQIVSLKVYNALGMEVADLVNEKKSAGRYSVSFDGSNLPSGFIFISCPSQAVGEILLRRNGWFC